MSGGSLSKLAGVAIALALIFAGVAPAGAMGLDPAYPHQVMLGPQKAKGVIIWSHGRSISSEDSKSPVPPYLEILRADDWDVMRFDRLRRDDTLRGSTARLVEYIAQLKREGYRQVALAGQSFGGFLSLMAADDSGQVDAVIATAPAAFGEFDDGSDAWRLNAIRLYPLLEKIKSARVMVFYFHDDDFDPGGRGERSRDILSRRDIGYSVIDQPFYLTGHWAASTGLFVRRFGDCVRDFADDSGLKHAFDCVPQWGIAPSADLKLPPQLTNPQTLANRESGSSMAPSADASDGLPGARPVWYGFYPNGRELLVAIRPVNGDHVQAIYAIGPSIDRKYPSTWSERTGRLVGGEYVFDEPGKNRLRFRLRDAGGLAVTWISRDGESKMTADLRRINPAILARPRAIASAQPQ